MVQADYTMLPTKAKSIESEKSTSMSATLTTLKSAASIGTDIESRNEDLNRKMSELIMIVKIQQVQSSNWQQ